ncbi:MAG: RdgB/HAM1 family non-canonical purine NTP pyrophosphatase [Thermomicrobiales bacterium]
MTRSASAEAAPRRLVLATANRGKVEELRHLLSDDWAILGMEEFNAEAAEETGSTFEENAILKAEAVALQTGLPSLADDSGLVVDALGGAPGVYSARYAGPASNDAANRSLLLAHMTRIETGSRSCRFVCVIALAVPGRTTATVRGTCEGTVGFRESGTNGFGYDSVFVLPDGRTMAELEADEKNAMSHRGQAMRIMLPMLHDARSSGTETC